jgi:hypothetical protein
MKNMTTVPFRMATSIAIGQTSLVQFEIMDRKSVLRRFGHFIESTDWEERYLCNRWIDRICLCGIFISMIYFIHFSM